MTGAAREAASCVFVSTGRRQRFLRRRPRSRLPRGSRIPPVPASPKWCCPRTRSPDPSRVMRRRLRSSRPSAREDLRPSRAVMWPPQRRPPSGCPARRAQRHRTMVDWTLSDSLVLSKRWNEFRPRLGWLPSRSSLGFQSSSTFPSQPLVGSADRLCLRSPKKKISTSFDPRECRLELDDLEPPEAAEPVVADPRLVPGGHEDRVPRRRAGLTHRDLRPQVCVPLTPLIGRTTTRRLVLHCQRGLRAQGN